MLLKAEQAYDALKTLKPLDSFMSFLRMREELSTLCELNGLNYHTALLILEAHEKDYDLLRTAKNYCLSVTQTKRYYDFLNGLVESEYSKACLLFLEKEKNIGRRAL